VKFSMYTPYRDAGREGHHWNVTSVIDVTDIAVQLVILLHDEHSHSQKVSYCTDPQGLSPCSQMLSPILSQMNYGSHTFCYISDPF